MNRVITLPPQQPMITGFFVTGLFGLYSYDVSLPKISDERGERLILIYGDNGSGKTTIVNLIYHLLSTSNSRGHRSFVANTQFKEFGLRFSDNRYLLARKKNKTGLGAYTLYLKTEDMTLSEVHVGSQQRDDEFNVKSEDVDDDKLEYFFDELFKTKLDCFLLSDNREFYSDYLRKNTTEENEKLRDYREQMILDMGGLGHQKGRNVDQPTRQLRQSVARAENWIKNQTLEARSANDASVSDIYKGLIERLGAYGTPSSKADAQLRDGLIYRLTSLAEATKNLSTMGMASDVPIGEYIEAIGNVDDRNLPLIAQILTPYFDSVQARVDGLEGIAKRLGTFVSTINSFYRNKTVRVDAVKGLKILASTDDPISVDVLSSGEKHLLMLMCNILVGTSQRSLFLVDEPELSLNVKWQRSLVDALLDLSSASSVQFFMATHSIELLAEHRESTLHLKNLS